MRITHFYLVFLSVFLLTCFPLLAQNNKIGQNASSKTYTIQKGEGLYRISVKLGTTMDELLRVNPSLQNGFSEGQVIIIPSPKTTTNLSTLQSDASFIPHLVEKGQTLYFLSQKYDIPIELIIQNNPGVESGLVEGTIVKIPKETQGVFIERKRSSDYLYHTIGSKETLYGISKHYNCAVNDILDANPGLNASGVKIGNELRIPKSMIGKQVVIQPNLPIRNQGEEKPIVDFYIVKKRDKISEIAKQFSLSEDALKNANPTIDFNNLKVGNKIVLPKQVSSVVAKSEMDEVPEEKIFEQNSKSKCGIYNYQSAQTTFKIAILLPFAASENLESLNGDGTTPTPLSSVSKIFLEYYEGSLLALDKLKREGVKVDCYVYDTWPDSTKISQILAKPEMKQMNLIFGPAYAVNLSLVSDFAKSNKIPLVYPLSSKNFELAENPYLFQINSNDSVIYDNVGRYLAAQNNSKIIAVVSQSPSMKELDILTKVKDAYKKSSLNQTNTFVEISFVPDNGFDKLLPTLAGDKSNLIFIPSEKESDVSLIVNSIHGNLKKSSAQISIIGMPEWLKYQTVSAEDIHASNTFVFSRSALDYYSLETQSFIKEYRLLYKSEPLAFSPYFQYGGKNPNYSRYGILGYDLTYYFVSALKEFGPQFQYCLNGFYPPLIQSNFIFKRVGNWGGFYDDGLFLVHFRPDFKIERVSLH